MFKKEFFLGVVCVIAGIMLWFGIQFLSGDNNPLMTHNNFYVEYDDINGLEKSNDISINGGIIGKVTDLILLPSNNSWLVEVTIDEPNILDQLTKKSVFEIQDDGFLGTKIILLKLAPGEKVFPGDTLKGELNGLMSQFSRQFDGFDIQQVMVPFLEVLEKVTTLASDLDRVIINNEQKINRVISSSENIAQNFSNSSDKMDKLVSNLYDFSKDLSKLPLLETSNNLNKDLLELKSILEKINHGNGTAAKIINDDVLVKEVQEMLNSIESLVNDVKNNPKKYFKFASGKK